MSVYIETSIGDVVVDLYTDECPLASKNFLKLCKYAPLLVSLSQYHIPVIHRSVSSLVKAHPIEVDTCTLQGHGSHAVLNLGQSPVARSTSDPDSIVATRVAK